ncbi:TetR/AcrR family transcriptional regulator [Dickeya oryzae]|uniref:TetR/AcrR family transcriptional regulator n=1 Tax=Dickeya oryzae TaxID=1240404 RepID=UPI002097F41B|nr:TetR/AcrR family transcriptional regulator [Dickeya oryzae]MCO7253406.1 TetR/AcrR family transcriptional regulator [Dickeya oryzae]
MSSPHHEEKTQARRDQIVAAARLCFRRSGFHGASMAEIAGQAQLSVGQIYRYFVNKDDIIEEIVRRIVDIRLQRMTPENGDPQRFIPLLARRQLPADLGGDDDGDDNDNLLMLEVASEATRNPRVANIMRDAEQKMFTHTSTLIKKRFPHFPDEDIAARTELIAVLCEGTTFRSLIPQHAPVAVLEQLYQTLIDSLFPEKTP